MATILFSSSPSGNIDQEWAESIGSAPYVKIENKPMDNVA